jgi:hypothetical protein
MEKDWRQHRVACTTNELKKKKNSLMFSFRKLASKVKGSKMNGSGTADY